MYGMSAKDKYHNIVRAALEKEGWTITDDPLILKAHGRNIQIDLGAEQLIGAERANEKIAVEIKSFIGLSVLTDFYLALGQFLYYQLALEKEDPERQLFLAVPDIAYENFFSETLTIEALERSKAKVVVYSVRNEAFVLWRK